MLPLTDPVVLSAAGFLLSGAAILRRARLRARTAGFADLDGALRWRGMEDTVEGAEAKPDGPAPRARPEARGSSRPRRPERAPRPDRPSRPKRADRAAPQTGRDIVSAGGNPFVRIADDVTPRRPGQPQADGMLIDGALFTGPQASDLSTDTARLWAALPIQAKTFAPGWARGTRNDAATDVARIDDFDPQEDAIEIAYDGAAPPKLTFGTRDADTEVRVDDITVALLTGLHMLDHRHVQLVQTA